MRSNFRRMETEDMAARMSKAANNAAAHLEIWAKDGYDSVKGSPAIWGAASLGIGAIAGGLYALWLNKDRLNEIYDFEALWHRNGKANGRKSNRTLAARLRTKSRRAKAKMNGAATMDGMQHKPAKRAKRTRRAKPAAQHTGA